MEAFVPDIQEALRTQGFPKFRREETQDVVLVSPEPRVTTSHRWVFTQKDDRTAVALATDFVALETTDYQMFEDFSELFRSVLEIVQEATGVALSQRLGLRYINFIRHQSDGQVFLRSHLLGLTAEELGTQELARRVEVRAVTTIGGLTVRVFDVGPGVFLPPDLSHDALKLSSELISGEGPASILDIDSFTEEQLDFEPEKLILRAWELHEFIERAFRASVTEEALGRWSEETGDE